jgi:hypothetical protein
MKPSTRIRRLCLDDPDTARYLRAVAGLFNVARQHVSAGRPQMAEKALDTARGLLAACLPGTREEFERIEPEDESGAGA